MTDDYTMPEVVRLLKTLTVDVRDLRGDVHDLGSQFVTRAEFEAWRTAYDRELKELKSTTAPVRSSPWTIVGVASGAVVGLGSLLGLLITLINVIP
ncbi:ElaB/YqjD/DUF883 family membrane-anchored ribosome-binding protein [Microbacterium resistens]|uniref:ElaB/YqjD/DUF883 family membrane-anchored ribosome-binding protein n=1 Tax=Microbacterium resistens TaxID=156977 RepID=A0ABU1SD68_9MICO|nr:hypothetical protein [Microbacterium resistens]MDR6867542.1 ElaB/YqjD/DUF883 family membrane-anchored ribosome-binding protein [Microbacterium resistens]